ncbi:SDR family NAD(P)-dependent oxidoreductase [Zhihengliuella flava]|uniref:Short-subunit dehydrogenase n=1 Tax=Zhihengliuella flava TaxID=1285193 RepID=A0A931GEY5_9MICC|nr:SDR family oxidoreductase [Zhihengliuella flava]MBG6084077.1 short-subunit dehydrogenase [Zhihengliuella flava]
METIDKVFVVTGGGAGIGREVVFQLLGKNARVAAVDLNEAALEETVRLANAGDKLSTHALNITDREAVEALPAQVKQIHGQVNGLINVAGIIHDFKPISELDRSAIERVMNVNFWGTVNTTTAFLPDLMAGPPATLMNVASMGSLIPFPGQSAYGASKAAVKLFTEGLIAEHQGTKLAVSVVFPGAIETEISKNSGAQMRERSVPEEIPAGKKRKKAKKPAKHQMTSAYDAAAEMVRAIEGNKQRVLIGKDAVMMDRMARIMPSRAITIIAKKMAGMAQ